VDGISQGAPSGTQNFLYTINSNVVIEVEVTDLITDCSDRESISMTALPVPNITLDLPINGDAFCERSAVTLTASPEGYSNYTYYADDGSGAVVISSGSSENFTKTDGFTTSTDLYVIAGDGGCTSQSNVVSITVNPLPNVTLTSDQSNDEFCLGRS
jgi:hypothetical protein